MPGVVVSRVNMSPRFMRELLDAMDDSWSKWHTTEGIRNLPEVGDDAGSSRAPTRPPCPLPELTLAWPDLAWPHMA